VASEISQSKIRRAKRYNLPLDVSLRIGRCSYEATVIDISEIGCRIRGNLSDISLPANKPCTVAFTLSAGYSKSLNRILPKKSIAAVIIKVTRSARDSELGDDYIIQYKDEGVGQFVTSIARQLHRFAKLTWRVPDFGQHIVELVDRFGHKFSGLTRGRVDMWLEQICDMNDDKDKARDLRNFALELLAIALSRYHYSYERCSALAKDLWNKILSLEGVDHNRECVRLFPLDIEAKSGHVTLYTMRVANNLPDHITRESFARLESKIERKRLQHVKWIVLVDDFLGSGKTANRYLKQFKTLARRLKDYSKVGKGSTGVDILEGKRIALACFVGFFDGDKWRKSKNNYPELKEYDDMLISHELSEAEDTIRSYLIVPPRHKDDLKALRDLVVRRKLYFHNGECHPDGFENLGALVSFYYSTPNNSLPILWSRSGGWQAPLPKRYETVWRSLKAPNPQPVPLIDTETTAKVKEVLDSRKKTIGIFGGPSSGKSNLAAELADYFGKDCCENVIWHEFADICSYDSFYCHVGWFLSEVCSLTELRENYFRGQSAEQLRQILVKALNRLKAYLFLGGVDRIKDASLRTLINDLISETNENVKIILTCRLDEKKHPPQWIMDSVDEPIILGQLNDQQIINIFNAVSGANLKVGHPYVDLVIHKSCRHPLVTWLLGSLYLKESGRFNDIVSTWTVMENPLVASTRNLFELLDEDLQWFLMVASLFVCPFETELVEGLYNNSTRYSIFPSSSFRDVQKCLQVLEREWKTPFVFKSEGSRYEMPVYLRDSVYDIWQEHVSEQREMEHSLAQLFESMETQEIAHKMDFIEIAHKHYLRAACFSEAAILLFEQRRVFTSNSGSNRLLNLVQQTLDMFDPHKLEQLVYLRARLLGSLTKFGSLHKLCHEEVQLLFPRMSHLSKARFAFVEARVNGSRRYFDDAWAAFDRVQGNLKSAINAGENVEECRILQIKTLLRQCQTRMSQGMYWEAWNELLKVIEELESYPKAPLMHELAVTCRHMHTLLYLSGEYAESLLWAEVAMALNDRLGDHEGIAIMQCKLARAWLALSNIKKADYFCSESLRTLDAHVSGGRWWRMAFLETFALIQLVHYEQNPMLSACIREAEVALCRAESLCADMEIEREETVRAHLSEVNQARAFLKFLKKDRTFICEWRKACKYLRTDPKDATSILDTFRKSELYFDYAYFKYKLALEDGSVNTHWVNHVIVPILRQSANMLRDACLVSSQKKHLLFLADVTKNRKGLELTELEALFRITAIDGGDRQDISERLTRARRPLRKLLRIGKIDPEGLKDYPISLSRLNQLKHDIEERLSQLVRTWADMDPSEGRS